jgi:hypothetical protein
MSEFFGHVAGAALPVAITLLVLTAVARAVLWAQLEGDERRLAHQYLGPLASWCLIAAGTYAFAVCASGDAGILPLGAALTLAVAAVLLRSEAGPQAAQPEPKADMPAHVRTPEPPAPEPTAPSLWNEPENAPSKGLWAR